jgi:hypothetical protein
MPPELKRSGRLVIKKSKKKLTRAHRSYSHEGIESCNSRSSILEIEELMPSLVTLLDNRQVHLGRRPGSLNESFLVGSLETYAEIVDTSYHSPVYTITCHAATLDNHDQENTEPGP